MITKRTLERWRREALLDAKLSIDPITTLDKETVDILPPLVKTIRTLSERILHLTREQLDEELMRRK